MEYSLKDFKCVDKTITHSWCGGRVSVIFHVRLTVHSSNLGHLLSSDKEPDKGKTLRPIHIFHPCKNRTSLITLESVSIADSFFMLNLLSHKTRDME